MKNDYDGMKEIEVRYSRTDLIEAGICFGGLEILGLFMVIKGIYLKFSVFYSIMILFFGRYCIHF